MRGSFVLDGDDNHVLVGADYSFHQLMDFLSAYDPESLVHLEGNTYRYVGGQLYEQMAVIRALIFEVRRLRDMVSDEVREP